MHSIKKTLLPLTFCFLAFSISSCSDVNDDLTPVNSANQANNNAPSSSTQKITTSVLVGDWEMISLDYAGTTSEVVAGQTVLARILPTDPNFLDIRTRSELQSAVEAADAGQALAEAEVKRMEAEVAFARSEYERAKKLYEKGNIAQSAMDRSEMQFRTQEAALLTKQKLIELKLELV